MAQSEEGMVIPDMQLSGETSLRNNIWAKISKKWVSLVVSGEEHSRWKEEQEEGVARAEQSTGMGVGEGVQVQGPQGPNP